MMIRIFFATDVHGSDKCWKKFINAGKFYKADVLILGGDMTGKAIVPIVEKSGCYEASFEGKSYVLSGDKINELVSMIKDKGYYPYIVSEGTLEELKCSQEKRNEIFIELILERAREWMRYADERLKGTGIKCFVCPGNDDPFEINEIIEKSECVVNAEGKVIQIDSYHEMISTGWANPTPWKTYKECCEEELYRKIEDMVFQVKNLENSIFNLHAPPYGSGLDSAPEIDESLKSKPRVLVPVGSTAVRQLIEKYQPLLGLHGHIHESRGFVKIGRTLCINPGSSYERGVLLGTLINMDEKKVKSYLPVIG